jgi:SHS2 domain-containing protein
MIMYPGRQRCYMFFMCADIASEAVGGRQSACWEHFAHGADIGVRGFGTTREQAFEQAAVGLTAVITDPAAITEAGGVVITCQAPDGELLLVDWLNALIYEMATRRWLFGRFAVRISGQNLSAQAWGEALDVARHRPAVEVKGATYTGLRVARQAEGLWVAQCVVDV